VRAAYAKIAKVFWFFSSEKNFFLPLLFSSLAPRPGTPRRFAEFMRG
jgi:hypothetical protein